MNVEDIILALLLLLAALLYSSVGHAGASGYLAAMALAGVTPEIMRPTALALNIVVAIVATTKFYRAGSFSWRLVVPLVITSIPLAYLGGRLNLPVDIYKQLIGAVLIFAAVRSFYTSKGASTYEIRNAPVPILLLTGAGLGFLSGLTGVGGGIFLSPLLLFSRWAPVKVISGVSAAFILVNSIAGILGLMSNNPVFHPALPVWAGVVLIGGYIGAEYGSRRLGNPTIQKLLGVVLLVAGIKMAAGV